MSKIAGRLVRLGLAIEATRGTGLAPTIWMPHVNTTLFPKVDEARDIGALGSLADSNDKLVTEKYAEGDITAELRDQSIGYFLYAWLGAVSTSGTASEYTHAFSLSESNQHKSLTIVEKSDIVTQMYKLAMLSRFEINMTLEGLVQFTAGLLAKSPVTTTQTPSYTTENKFTKKGVKIYIATDLAGLSSATALETKALTLTSDLGTERDSAHGTVQPVDILNKMISIEGSMSLNYENNTLRDYMVNGDKKAVRIDIEDLDTTLTANTPRLRIELPKVDFSEWEGNYALEDIVSQTIKFKANYDTTNGIISTCSLRNGKASY